jgi:hypothetical protein
LIDLKYFSETVESKEKNSNLTQDYLKKQDDVKELVD